MDPTASRKHKHVSSMVAHLEQALQDAYQAAGCCDSEAERTVLKDLEARIVALRAEACSLGR